jgi:hypothetical protein
MLEQLNAAEQLPFDIDSVQHIVNQELDSIEFFERQVATLESRIKVLYRKLDPEALLLQIPGIGDTIGAALHALIGDVRRFPNGKAFAAYTGLVPRTKLTGGEGKPGQRMTKAGSNLMKQYLFLAAETARLRDAELAKTYSRAIERGHHHNSAIVIVAHKLTRAIYAVLKKRASADDPAVTYRFREPVTGNDLTAKEALAYVRTNHPSKAARARQARAAQHVPVVSGSSADATTGSTTPPPPALTTDARSGKARVQPVTS